jgi:hypothetical protein
MALRMPSLYMELCMNVVADSAVDFRRADITQFAPWQLLTREQGSLDDTDLPKPVLEVCG